MRTLAALAATGISLIGISPARAISTPVVPPFVEKLVRARAGALAYVPTRAPFGYRYARYRWDGRLRVLTVTLADRRFALDGRHSLVFSAERFPGASATCGDGRDKTLQMAGNRVFWDGEVAWRCIRGSAGVVRLAASGPKLPDVALARVVASAKRSRA